MKLLFDQNLAYKLIEKLKDLFPNSTHVYFEKLHLKDDYTIWQYASNHDYIIVTRDYDFYDMSLIFGHPPKVILIKSGNSSTSYIEGLIRSNFTQITDFEKDDSLLCLELF